jgi:hypothetical protein
VNEEREDFILKLMLIEQEGDSLLQDLPDGLMRDRAQRIVTIAKLLKARLEVAAPLIIPPRPARKPDDQ